MTHMVTTTGKKPAIEHRSIAKEGDKVSWNIQSNHATPTRIKYPVGEAEAESKVDCKQEATKQSKAR